MNIDKPMSKILNIVLVGFQAVPKPKQLLVFVIVSLTFLVPVVVSCVTYVLVYCSVVVEGKTRARVSNDFSLNE